MNQTSEPRCKPRPAFGEDRATRDEILDAAARLIATKGLSACTMRSISEQVNIKAGSLYYHFASKDEIIVEIMNLSTVALLAQVRAAVEALPEDAPFCERLAVAMRVHIRCKLDRQTPFMRVYEHLTPVIKRQGRVMRKRYSEFWKELLAQGSAAGDLRGDLDLDLFVSFLLSSLNRTPEWANPEHKKLEEVVNLIVRIVFDGVLVERSS